MRSVIEVMMLLGAITLQSPPPGNQAPPPTPTPPDVHRKVEKLAKSFVRHDRPDDRAKVSQQLLSLGQPGAVVLRELASSEVSSIAPALFKASAHATKERLSAIDPETTAQVLTARKKVLDLLEVADLSKEQIVNDADPAVAYLREVWAYVPISGTLKLDRRQLEAFAKLQQDWAFLDAADEVLGTRQVGGPPSAPQRLQAVEINALSAAIGNGHNLAILSSNVAMDALCDAEEAIGTAETNRIRVLVGLPAARIDPKLVTAARGHSKDMVVEGFFSHESPVSGKKTFGERAKLVGTTASLENIYHGSAQGTAPIQSWWHSPGHFKNLLSNYDRMGLGRYGDHWTFIAEH